MQIPVQICVKGKLAAGMLHVPEKRAKGSPVVMMCYGLNGDRVEVHRMSVIAARQAEAMGITFFRFDYRGLGLSEGEFQHSSIDSKIEDAMAAIDFLKGCFQSEDHTLILLGFCDGARITCKIANMRSDIGGLAMWNPIFSQMPAVFRSEGDRPKMVREPDTKELVYPFFGLWMGTNYLKQVNSKTDIQEFTGLKIPKLLVFGGNDLYTEETRKYFIKYECQQDMFLDMVTIQNAKHLFNSTDWTRQVIDQTLAWTLSVGGSKSEG